MEDASLLCVIQVTIADFGMQMLERRMKATIV